MVDGMKIMDIPSIRPVLQITEPSALLIASSGEPDDIANVDTISSGSVVHKLTIVAPIIICGMCRISASHTEASTNQSPPFIMRMKPSKNNISGSTNTGITPNLSL